MIKIHQLEWNILINNLHIYIKNTDFKAKKKLYFMYIYLQMCMRVRYHLFYQVPKTIGNVYILNVRACIKE